MRRWEDGTFKPYNKQRQAAGRKGGKATGDSKARTGASNGKFSEGRIRFPCCGAIKGRSHKKTCENHSVNKIMRVLREESIDTISVKKIDTTGFIEAAPVMRLLYALDGVCVGCNKALNARESKLVFQADIMQVNPIKVICRKCE
jgi:hypothetical protein